MDNLVALPSGTVLVGDYRLQRVLGAGGFGITYLADEIALNRKVAIKEYFPGEFAARDGASQVRHRSGADSTDYTWGLERFIEEAQTLARFDHTNIVRVFRYFRANNTAYMVLQFEEGRSFRQWIDDQRQAPQQSALDAIVHPLLHALELLHNHDFLHRDIAADNILIRQDGSPVLIDFGSARGDVAKHTKTLSALVKPGYSPFEQYASNGKRQGPWTDIYALAATLYFAVTGVRPPDSPSRITADDMRPATAAARGTFRPGFLAAIDRALSLQIEARPATVAAWRQELFAEAPTPAAARGKQRAPAPAHHETRITRKIETGAAPELVWKKRPVDLPETNDPLPAVLVRRDAKQRANDALKNAKAKVSSAAQHGGAKVSAARNAVQDAAARSKAGVARALAARPKLPEIPSPKAIVERLRGKNSTERAQRSLIKQLDAQVKKPLAPKREKKPASNKASWGAALRNRLPKRKIKPRAAETPYVARRIPPARKRPSLARRIAWWTGTAAKFAGIVAFVSFLVLQNRVQAPTVAAWSQKTAPATTTRLELLKTFRGHNAAITALAVSDDGKRVVSTSRDGANVIWNPASGAEVRSLDPGSAQVTAIDIADNRLMLGQDDGQVSLWDLKTGNRVRAFRLHKGTINAAVFSRSAARVVSAGGDENLRIWNAKRGSWRSLRGHKGSVTALATSADGKLLVSGGADKTVKLWDATRSKVRKTLHGHGGVITAVAMTASGKAFASGSADESIRIYPRLGDGDIKTLYGHSSAVTALAFSPNGRLLASASADHAVKLWNAETGDLIHTFVGHTDAVSALAFMPDGRRLVTASADKTVRIWQSQVTGYR